MHLNSSIDDYALKAALENNNSGPDKEIVKILASREGANDESDWHWIVELDDGSYSYLTGGCDYTGWDCHSNLHYFLSNSILGILKEVPVLDTHGRYIKLELSKDLDKLLHNEEFNNKLEEVLND